MITLNETEMEKVISGFQIPVKPEILTNIQHLMSQPEPNIDSIAALIANDVGLSSAILKVINSPFYGMNRKISEIKQAVMILGLTTINGLVTAISLKNAFQGKASISLERFWDDALNLANAMAYLGRNVKNKIPVDMLYTIGLFSDCGIPLFAIKYSDYKGILINANSLRVSSIAFEEKQYRTNHAVLGYYVANSWHLPKELCQIILLHHDPKVFSALNNEQDLICLAVLKAGENLVEKAKRHQEAIEWLEVKDDVLSILGLSESEYGDIEDDYNEIFNIY